MEKIFEIQTKKIEKSLFCSGNDELNIKNGDICIVELTNGVKESGKVYNIFEPLLKKYTISGKVLKKADEHDFLIIRENQLLKADALKICNDKINQLKIPLKLIDAEYSFDRTIVTFYYWAESRIDFRKLVKEIAGIFNCRIEMRQIGLRDEAKIKDGYGICGQRICCARFLKEFGPITMKSVKSQNLPLDMNKISGLCGRLMCCLVYESQLYEKEEK
jgi:cell fate regulator YaaT (PSP1 superfamily)